MSIQKRKRSKFNRKLQKVLLRKRKRFKLGHDIAAKKKEESKKLTESWANQEKTPKANKEEKQKTRKDSPESTSSEPKNTGNRKIKRTARFRMIRLKPATVILTPAPGWEEAEGRQVQRGRVI